MNCNGSTHTHTHTHTRTHARTHARMHEHTRARTQLKRISTFVTLIEFLFLFNWVIKDIHVLKWDQKWWLMILLPLSRCHIFYAVEIIGMSSRRDYEITAGNCEEAFWRLVNFADHCCAPAQIILPIEQKNKPVLDSFIRPLPVHRTMFCAGLDGSVGCASDWWSVIRRPRVWFLPGPATFFRRHWSWNTFYSHSLPSAISRRTGVKIGQKNVHKDWSNALRGLSLPRKSVVK